MRDRKAQNNCTYCEWVAEDTTEVQDYMAKAFKNGKKGNALIVGRMKSIGKERE